MVFPKQPKCICRAIISEQLIIDEMPIIIPRSKFVQKLSSKKFKGEEAYLEYGDSPRHEAEEVADVIGEMAWGEKWANKRNNGSFREGEWKVRILKNEEG